MGSGAAAGAEAAEAFGDVRGAEDAGDGRRVRGTGVERLTGECVRLVDELARAREVEQITGIARAREHDDLDVVGDVPELELEALAARVGEARHHDVERRALDPFGHGARHVEHEHAVDRSRERVPQRHAVVHTAIHEPATVMAPNGGHARPRAARVRRPRGPTAGTLSAAALRPERLAPGFRWERTASSPSSVHRLVRGRPCGGSSRAFHTDRTRFDARQSAPVARFVLPKVATRILRDDPELVRQPDARVTEFYRQYLAVAVFVLAAFVMVGAMLGVARILRPNVPQADKYITYESGSDPPPLFRQANVRYYVYALLFVVFGV